MVYRKMRFKTVFLFAAASLLASPLSYAANSTYYVCMSGASCGAGWVTGKDTNSCTTKSAPCLTLAGGIGKLGGGDTLIVGNGTYPQSLRNMPSGTASAYTSIQAENDWGVTIDGSGFADNFTSGIDIRYKSYVKVQGFKVRMSQAKLNNEPVVVYVSDHIKISKCSAAYGPISGNAASFDIANSSYVLVEDSHAFGGTRYMFLAYWSDHVLFRRNVARNDYWNGSLQCAAFVNYDSVNTAWQNNIALDSDTANCKGTLYGGFWSENKSDHASDTSQTLYGNIVLNVTNGAYAAGDTDNKISGTRTIDHLAIWGGNSGYLGGQGVGIAASATLRNLTIGALTGTYDGRNGAGAGGTGVAIADNISNSVRNSIFYQNRSYGIADYTLSDYNAFFGNGALVGGHFHVPTVGSHSLTTTNPTTSGLRYLPRIEDNSVLKKAGEGGAQMGAQIVNRMGVSGTLHGDPGWNTLTSEALWPFPNEAQIKSAFASYSGPGAAGARGFAKGNSLDGTAQTLTKYIWEYLGHQIPGEIYGGSGTSFSDVPASHWAARWIEQLYTEGITGGCAENPLRYCPDALVTRAEMAVFLERISRGGTYMPPNTTSLFADVGATHWAKNWINQLYADGITAGCGSSPLRYCPQAWVTRAEMAVFLERAARGGTYVPPVTAPMFADVGNADWAKDWVNQLYTDGITTGCGTSPSRYCPQSLVTRAEMAVFLLRLEHGATYQPPALVASTIRSQSPQGVAMPGK